jgi:cytochrome c oxidase subunit 2
MNTILSETKPMRLLRSPRLRSVVLLGAVALLATSCGWSLWDSPMTAVRARSDLARSIDGLFMLISWTTLVIFIAVEAALLYACWRFRDRPGAPIPKQIHGHTLLEISWTVAFAVILLIIGIPTVKIIFKTQEAPAAGTLRVDVVGKQWWWEFSYPELKITTANELHLPVNEPVVFYLHGPDVIHSFWVPGIAIGKRDVVPHRVNRLMFTPEVPGEYPGQCAEYCGTSHANMRLLAVVHPKGGFEQWVKAQQAPPVQPTDPLAQQGQSLFTQSACVGCHTIAGVSAGRIGPDLTHFGSRKTLASNMMPNTAANLARWIENPSHVKPGALMPNLGMTAEQSKALAAYLLALK